MCVNAPFRYFMDIQRFRGTNPLVPIKKACWREQTALQGNKQNTALQFFTIIIDVHFSYHIMFKGVFVLEQRSYKHKGKIIAPIPAQYLFLIGSVHLIFRTQLWGLG